MTEKKEGYTVSEILETINRDLDMRTLLYNMFTDDLIHPESSLKNSYLLNGSVDFLDYLDYTVDKMNNVPCLFHENNDTNNARIFVDNNTYTCFSGKCEHEKRVFNVVILYRLLRFSRPYELLFVDSGDEFKQAVEELAAMLDIPFKWKARKESKEDRHAKRIEAIQRRMMEFYHSELLEGKYKDRAIDYLKGRGFEHGVKPLEALIVEHKLGYASGRRGWTTLYRILKKEGFTDHELTDASCIKEYTVYDEKGNATDKKTTGDFFYDGIILPYRNTISDKVYGIYKRRISKVADEHRHRRGVGMVEEPPGIERIHKFESFLVTEGEMSYLSLLALGHENTILNRGTGGLHDEHILKLKNIRFNSRHSEKPRCQTAILCFDGDEAGDKAVVKTGKRLREAGFNVLVVRLPRYEKVDPKTGETVYKGDPNDLLQNEKERAIEVFQNCLDNAISFEAFVCLRYLNQSNTSSLAYKRIAFERTKEFFIDVSPEEKIFIFEEVAQAANLTVREQSLLASVWSLPILQVIPTEEVLSEELESGEMVSEELIEEPVVVEPTAELVDEVETEESNESKDDVVILEDGTWLLLASSVESRDTLRTSGFTNVLFHSPERLIATLKHHDFQSIVFDSNTTSETISLFQEQLPQISYYVVTDETVEPTSLPSALFSL